MLKKLDKQIAAIRQDIRCSTAVLNDLLDKRNTLRSERWRDANGVTLDQIQLSYLNGGANYYRTLAQFLGWIRDQELSPRFVEWNGNVYLLGDIVAGRIDLSQSCYLTDVEKNEARMK